MAMRLARLAIILVLGRTIVATARGAEPLGTRVEAVLKTSPFQNGHWGLLVVEGASGKVVYERNADQLFCPASVTKLFSTSAALAELGADYHFETPVVRRGEVDKDGTLKGDLILVARGDMCFGGRTGSDGGLLFENADHTYSGGNLDASLVACDPLAGLDHLAREVRSSGIKAVSGDVLVDDRLFEASEATGSGPSRVVPIVVNDNVVDVVAAPGPKPGDPALVRIVPETAFVTMDARVDTGEEGSTSRLVVLPVGPRRFTVRGRIAIDHKPVVKTYEVEEPSAFARTLFIETLRRRGVKVEAPAIGDNSADRLLARGEVARLPEVAEYTSPPFREYVKVILKVSHNLHASTLPLLLAARHEERTLADGLKREGAALKGLGVDVATIAFGGGAGGARADLVTPRATVALLRAMAARPDFRAFDAALPVLGRDGTLAKAVDHDSPARGHARAKTGTYLVDNALTGKAVLTSKALAGYMETAAGRPLVFAFFVNEVPIDGRVSDATLAAGRLLGSLCELFYTADTPDDSSP